MTNAPILIVYGQTASGKSDFAEMVAHAYTLREDLDRPLPGEAQPLPLRSEQGGREIDAFLPISERPRTPAFCRLLRVIEEEKPATRKTTYTVVAVDRDRSPVMLHTLKTNAVARYLLERRLVPGWKTRR